MIVEVDVDFHERFVTVRKDKRRESKSGESIEGGIDVAFGKTFCVRGVIVK